MSLTRKNIKDTYMKWKCHQAYLSGREGILKDKRGAWPLVGVTTLPLMRYVKFSKRAKKVLCKGLNKTAPPLRNSDRGEKKFSNFHDKKFLQSRSLLHHEQKNFSVKNNKIKTETGLVFSRIRFKLHRFKQSSLSWTELWNP